MSTDDGTVNVGLNAAAAARVADDDVLPAPHIEYAIEVTWRDPVKAGASGPACVYGPLLGEDRRDSFLDAQRRDSNVAATRVLTRLASYTDWASTQDPEPTSREDREARLDRMLKQNRDARLETVQEDL